MKKKIVHIIAVIVITGVSVLFGFINKLPSLRLHNDIDHLDKWEYMERGRVLMMRGGLFDMDSAYFNIESMIYHLVAFTLLYIVAVYLIKKTG